MSPRRFLLIALSAILAVVASAAYQDATHVFCRGCGRYHTRRPQMCVAL